MTVRREPCSACPYRRDVASGVWAPEEYEKLEAYDGETWEQPTVPFACHATPEHYCHGWAVVGGYDLLALRLRAARGENIKIPEAAVPLFSSGTEAAEHGRREIEQPGEMARETIQRLARKHPRLKS